MVRILKLCALGLLVFDASFALAAKRDFKGLFGNYRREKFVENEAKDTSLTLDVLFSTVLPVTPFVKTTETGDTGTAMQYATFFNGEIAVSYAVNYAWQFFGSIGVYNYDTRKANAQVDAATNQPIYHLFEIQMYPIVVGAKYRFSRQDLVPYLGVSGGMGFGTRKASYDNSNTVINSASFTVPIAQAFAGLEFYISSSAGLRLEVGGSYYGFAAGQFNPQNTIFATFNYQANPIAMRYASGVFFVF